MVMLMLVVVVMLVVMLVETRECILARSAFNSLSRSSCAILRLLVLHGCNVNVKDARGRSLPTLFVLASAQQEGVVGVCAALTQLLDPKGSGGRYWRARCRACL